MSTIQDRREGLLSVDYLEDMRMAWSVVKDLHKAGVPVERLVWRARSLYHRAWQDEVRRRHAA